MLSFLESGGGGLFATSCRDKRAPRVYSDTSPPPPPSAGRGTGRESGEGVKLHVDEEERYTMVQK